MTSKEVGVKTLKDFGYGFNSEGKLRQLDPATGEVTDKQFNFEISSSREKNQKHYEALGETITDVVYELLDKHGMHRIYLPEGQPEEEATFVFSTQKELKSVDKLMVIIHGSGVVRAGARSLVINHSLDAGTVLPYIKRAQSLGFEVLVTNTNDNRRDGKRIRGSESPEAHATTVWTQIVQPSNAKSIAIVAHSYGGVVACSLDRNFKEDFTEKVFAVAFTDSVHGSTGGLSLLDKIGINFVASQKPLGTRISHSSEMPLVSAGHPKHEMTSYSCIDPLFEFVEKRYKEHQGQGDDASSDGGKSPETKKPKTDEL